MKRPYKILLTLLIAWLIMAQGCMKFRISDSKSKKEFDQFGVKLETGTYNSNGFDLHFAKTGNDSLPTLFFVHGSPGSWNAFEVYMRDNDLLGKYRMYSIDRPGFGYSQFGDDKNLAEQTKIILPFIQSVENYKPVYIVGHSLGGPLAAKLAAENPGLFKGLVILAGSIDPDEEPQELWRGLLYYTPLQYLIPGAFRPSNNEIWAVKPELKSLKKELGKITGDVYIIHGDADTFVPVGNAAYAKKLMINARSMNIKIIKGAPHFIPWEPWYGEVKDVLLKLK